MASQTNSQQSIFGRVRMGYTLVEWEDMMSRFHLTTLEALQWGIPLHGEALFAQWHEHFVYWKSLGLCRGKGSWFIPPQLDRDCC